MNAALIKKAMHAAPQSCAVKSLSKNGKKTQGFNFSFAMKDKIEEKSEDGASIEYNKKPTSAQKIKKQSSLIEAPSAEPEVVDCNSDDFDVEVNIEEIDF